MNISTRLSRVLIDPGGDLVNQLFAKASFSTAPVHRYRLLEPIPYVRVLTELCVYSLQQVVDELKQFAHDDRLGQVVRAARLERRIDLLGQRIG